MTWSGGPFEKREVLSMGELQLVNITKIYDDAQGTERAVDEVMLNAHDDELVVIVGPSGCGKSTTLRMVAGLETTTEGKIKVSGREVQDLGPSRRNVAMVFQSYALYTKMTARENMEYGLKHSTDLTKTERRERVERMAELLGIDDLIENYPNQMSGGEKQRVALGRALVREPDVFLLDEPLSNLDAKLRAAMRTELQRIHKEIGVTTLYVTHDQKEAMTMADRIAIMNDGKLQQFAEPEEAYYHPTNKFVATFLGSPAMNIFTASVTTLQERYCFEHEDTVIAHVPANAVDGLNADAVDVGLRPEDLILTQNSDDGHFTAEVSISEYQGNDNFVHLKRNDVEFTARVPPTMLPERNDVVGVSANPEHVYLFDIETGETLKTRGVEERKVVPDDTRL